MRKSRTFILALFAIFLAAGLPSTAQSSPVVDQYTEDRPSPGGPIPVDPTNTGKPGPGNVTSNTNSSGSGTDNGSSAVSGDTGTANDGTEGDGSAASPAKPDKTDKVVTSTGANQADTDEDRSFGIFATSGGDDGGSGMGWMFPASLVLVAVLIAGAAILRRNRGHLAT